MSKNKLTTIFILTLISFDMDDNDVYGYYSSLENAHINEFLVPGYSLYRAIIQEVELDQPANVINEYKLYRTV